MGGGAPGLKKIEDATDFAAASLSPSSWRRRRRIRRSASGSSPSFVGGGATGVEMAGAIAELARNAARDFRVIDPDARIVLVEAGPRLLPLSILVSTKRT